jgi:hypothetical protein
VANLRGLLHSTDVELRIAAGEALALVLEFAYEHDEQYEPEDLLGLVADVKQLATDSTKSRSKKDRKEQRSSFREVSEANLIFTQSQIQFSSRFCGVSRRASRRARK